MNVVSISKRKCILQKYRIQKCIFLNRNENTPLLFIGIILKTNTYLYGDAIVYRAVFHEWYYILESRKKLTALSMGFGMMLRCIMTNSSRHTGVSEINNDTKTCKCVVIDLFSPGKCEKWHDFIILH